MINSYEALFYTSMIIVPGFLISKAYNCFFSTRKHSDNSEFFMYLLMGLISYIFSSTMIELSLIYVRNKKIAFILNSCLSIILLVLLFYIISKIINGNYFSSFINKVLINYYPSAWDYMFSKKQFHMFEITLKDGSVIYGSFGKDSSAPVKYYDCDIYLEATYSLNKELKLVKDKDTKGIYINGSEIVTIRDLKKEDE